MADGEINRNGATIRIDDNGGVQVEPATGEGVEFTGPDTGGDATRDSVNTDEAAIGRGSTVGGDVESRRFTKRDDFVSVGFRGVDRASLSEGFTVDVNGATAVMGGSNGLNVFDVSEGTPRYRSTSANTNTQPYGVKLDGSAAVCANYDTDTVTLVDVSEQANPTDLDNLGTGTSSTLEGPRKVALDSKNKIAYVSASKNTNHALNAIDYSGNSLSLLWSVSGAEFERAFHAATAPEWPVVYVAAEDGSNHVVVVDKSTESVVTTASSANTNGAYGVALNTARQELYVTANDAQAVSVWGVSDPHTPSELGAVSDPNLDNAYGLAERGDYVYVASKIANAYVVIDKSEPTSPRMVTSVTKTDHAEIDQPYDVALSRDAAFVPNRGTSALVSFGGQNQQLYSGYAFLSSGSTSISAGATKTIPFDQTTRNDGGVVDGGTGEWTIPTDGVWEFSLSARINDLPDGIYAVMRMNVNGTAVQNRFIASGTETINSSPVTFGKDLSAGDTVTFDVVNEATSSISLQGRGAGVDNTWVLWKRVDV